MAVTQEQIQAAIARKQAKSGGVDTKISTPTQKSRGVTNADIQAAIARKQQALTAKVTKNQPQFEAREPSFGEKIGSFGEKISRAIGLGGDPIIQRGAIDVFAEKKGRELSTGIKEEGAPFIGETIGEAVGSKLGAKGRIAGAGIGRAAGDAFKQIGQQIVDSPNAPDSIKQAAGRLLKEFAIGAGTEAVSEGLVKSFRHLATTMGFKSTALKPLPDFEDISKLANKAGITLTPAQRTSSRAIDTFEEIAENAFFGRGRIRDIKQVSQPAGIRRATDQLLDSFLPKAKRVGRDELGTILSDTIAERNTAFKKAGSALYKRVDRVNKKAVVDLAPLKAFATTLKKSRLKEGGLPQPIDNVIEDLLSRPDIADFGTAHRIKSTLSEVARNSPSKKDRIVGITKQASKLMDKQMETASKNLNPDAYKVWKTADAFWKDGKQTFNSKIIKRVTKSVLDDTPNKVLDVIFQAKSPQQIRTVMNLADPLTKKRLRYAFMDNMLEKSTRQVPGDISDLRTLIGQTFIEKFDSFGDEALSAVFSKEEKQRIRNVARLAKTTQGKTGGAGSFLIQLIQAAPLGATGTGIVAGQPQLAKKGIVTGIPIAAFTDGLSRLMASPKGSKILTDMIDVPRGTENIAALGARLTREMARIQAEKKRESLKEKQQPTKVDPVGFYGI